VSLLTPTGYDGRRRHSGRRTAVTLLVALLLVVAAGYVSWQMVTATASPAANPSGCPAPSLAPSTAAVAPAQVQVNVYNATNRPGLARQVADELIKRGFGVASVANDPLNKKIAAPAEVRHGPGGAAQAALVATQVPGAVLVPDGRTDGSVDLVLGDGYKQLGPPPAAGKAAPATVTPSLPAGC